MFAFEDEARKGSAEALSHVGGEGGLLIYIAVPRCENPLKTYVNNAWLLVDMSHMRVSNPLGWPHTQTQTMYTQTRYKQH